MPGLDPVVEKTMKATFDVSNTTSGLHILDEQRWLSLFPALLAAGYTWDINDVYTWLGEHWLRLEDDDDLDHDAIKVYAWAEMALEQANPSDMSDWGESIVQNIEDELAG